MRHIYGLRFFFCRQAHDPPCWTSEAMPSPVGQVLRLPWCRGTLVPWRRGTLASGLVSLCNMLNRTHIYILFVNGGDGWCSRQGGLL